uniref:Light-harvesting complex protein n=1 Tax=Vaucheria litorea TaxID=109269 RepID=H6WB74_VAULI|nr:light-harvesting complex protein [Vaucheria litorea]|mmetsp:Transcript_16639/g.24640  ORF Transcript_16639/g.24640 Transcript_16639/m.24640 type:complete len:274 (-) Transcript_16639:62-883(-)|eukprot:CAMPEP_0171452108 /NCGR_PEP_ID=MMETSP0945-20130129/342_1 /TAXON_ID=109269 /ORGANISM="Vaucheria litorea, Strain CCMP2940" /LENGTH=273 /DNA_ID=CAMNT_0011976697 /DNA_START=64 /DNA_END=885 /DNA_ORIENTATION=+
MKTSAIVLVAGLSAANAFAPASSFNGVGLASTTRASSSAPQMILGWKKKSPKAPEPPAPVSKRGTPAKKVAPPATSSKFSSKKPAPVQQAPPSTELAIEFGSDVEAPFWDPVQLSADKSEETLAWYRSAELKHGRVAMLACLGTFVNGAGIALPDPVFQGTSKSFDALTQIANERPAAVFQVILAIAAIEALSVQLPEGRFPGDLGFDPLKQTAVYEGKGQFDALRLRELKNGRLAMIGIAGMWAQEALTGQGVFEQLAAGHYSPVGDGQGYF